MAAKSSHSIPLDDKAIASRECAAKILKVFPAITHFLRSEVRHFGQPRLSLSQLRILCFLDKQPQSSLSEVAEYLDVRLPSASGAVERLVQQGLVDRASNPQERRQVLLSLTSEGNKYQQEVYQALLAHIEEKLSSLSESESSQIIQGLLLLETLFSEETEVIID